MRASFTNLCLIALIALSACKKQPPPPSQTRDILPELAAGLIEETPGQEAAPGAHPVDGAVVLTGTRRIRCRLPGLAGAKILLRCFSEYLPPGARIHASLPEARELFPDFEGAVLDRKAEFFLRLPLGLPEDTLFELRISGAEDGELRIREATLESSGHAP